MPPIADLLRRQHAAGFPDVAGTEVAATFPITDRLLNEIIAAQLPPSSAVRDVQVRARPGDSFVVNVRLARPSFLPPIGLTLHIVRQPQLPHDPELILEVASSALMSIAGPALRGFDVLPPGVRLAGNHVYVNVRTILEERGLAEVMRYLEDLRVGADERRIVVSIRARIPPLS